jgi:DNA-binding PucR family transcriptional regulator
VAIGLEGAGPEGFRSSHRQALRARRFGAEVGPELLFYDSVAVEVLAIENEEDARAFVAHQLRGIEDDSVTSRRIRETLEAYFAAEHNAASAGAALGVHQQTVANRLRAAEERLGGAIGPRRVELEVALRLKACLDRS